MAARATSFRRQASVRHDCATRLAATLLSMVGTPAVATAQTATPPSTPPSTPPAVAAPYRAPVLAMVEPANGGAVPADRPVVVFRFAPGEADDPLDLRSFAVSVDGQDRSARFQVTASEAWGPLAGGESGEAQAAAISAGAHRVTARLCSSRGACSAADLTVIVTPALSTATSTTADKHGLLQLLLGVVRRLLLP